jgi:hypothetical protein
MPILRSHFVLLNPKTRLRATAARLAAVLTLAISLREHAGLAQKYNVTKLMWFQNFFAVDAAIQREKTMKKWSRV